MHDRFERGAVKSKFPALRREMQSPICLLEKIVGGAFVIAILLISPSRADVIFSEDFSSGISTGIPDGWSVTDGFVFVATPAFDAGLSGNALALDFVDYRLNPPNWSYNSTIVSNPFDVVPGGTYTVSWDVATFYTNGSEGPEGAVRRPRLLFNTAGLGPGGVGGPDFNVNAQLWSGVNSATTAFTNQIFTFVAQAPELTLSLADNSNYPGNLGGFTMVKDVVVTGDPTPEPAVAVLMLGGIGMLFAFRRSRGERR